MDDDNIPPPKKEDELQFIHSKLVGSPLGLSILLKKTYGLGNFEVEVRFE
jgi:hypothetical protein